MITLQSWIGHTLCCVNWLSRLLNNKVTDPRKRHMTEEKMQPYPSMGVFAELVKQEYKGEDRDAIIYFAETTCAAITQMGGSAAFARPSVACTSLVVGWPGPSDESNLALLFQKSIKRVKVVLNEIKTSLPTHVVFVPAVPTRLVGIGCMEITDVSFSVQDEADGAAHLKVDRDVPSPSPLAVSANIILTTGV